MAVPVWLVKGFGLLKVAGSLHRDYFLPGLSTDMMSFQDRVAIGGDLAGMCTRVLMELSCPVFDCAKGWVKGPEKLLSREAVCGFTGHSERATLPSLLAAMGFRGPSARRWGDGRQRAARSTFGRTASR